MKSATMTEAIARKLAEKEQETKAIIQYRDYAFNLIRDQLLTICVSLSYLSDNDRTYYKSVFKSPSKSIFQFPAWHLIDEYDFSKYWEVELTGNDLFLRLKGNLEGDSIEVIKEFSIDFIIGAYLEQEEEELDLQNKVLNYLYENQELIKSLNI